MASNKENETITLVPGIEDAKNDEEVSLVDAESEVLEDTANKKSEEDEMVTAKLKFVLHKDDWEVFSEQ